MIFQVIFFLTPHYGRLVGWSAGWLVGWLIGVRVEKIFSVTIKLLSPNKKKPNKINGVRDGEMPRARYQHLHISKARLGYSHCPLHIVPAVIQYQNTVSSRGFTKMHIMFGSLFFLLNIIYWYFKIIIKVFTFNWFPSEIATVIFL